MDEFNGEIVVKETGEVKNNFDFSNNKLMILAEQADKNIQAVKKIMSAALMITNENDWVLIGGTPYLQETGASKVARLFGISWKIKEPTVITDPKGYKTYYFKGEFIMQSDTIECEGSRSMKDDFFCRTKDEEKSTKEKTVYRMKTPDEIDERDVRMSAYTNCINNGIKRLIPGIRNLKIEDLEKANLKTDEIKGYTFKEKKETKSKTANAGLVCSDCGKVITQAEASYSQGKFGVQLCRICQKKAKEKPQNEPEVVPEDTQDVEE